MPLKDFIRTLNSHDDELLQRVINKLGNVELTVYIYNENQYLEEKCSDVHEILSAMSINRSAHCVWIEVCGPIEKRQDVIQQLGVHFGLHLLTLEDIQTVEEKTKIEIFDDGIYLLMKMVYVHEHSWANIQQQQVSFYLKNNLLITFQEKRTSLFSPIKERLAHKRGRLTKLKSDYLFYCLVYIIVENYMIVLDLLGSKIADIDDELMQMTALTPETLKLIYRLKHDMLHFRTVCAPLKHIIIKLQKSYDRLPRRDPFAVRTSGPKPLKKKRGRRPRRPSRPPSIPYLQPIKNRGQSLSPVRKNTLQPINKSRRQSLSPTPSMTMPRKRTRGTSFIDDQPILHEYMFMYLKNLHDQILQLNDNINTYSEMADWLVHFYMALNAIDVREKMKLLAMIHIVYYPMMFMHGINSMNFRWVPQRDDFKYSYYIFVGLIILLLIIAITSFKIKKWF